MNIDNLLSGIIGALGGITLSIIFTIIWDINKQRAEKRAYQLKIKNQLYTDFLEMLQVPIEKFRRGSEELNSWYIEMEKLHFRLAVIGEESFIKIIISMYSNRLSENDTEELRFKEVNSLREYYGNSAIDKKDYDKLLRTSLTKSKTS